MSIQSLTEERTETASNLTYYTIASVLAVIITLVLYWYAPAVSDWWAVFHKIGSSWLDPYQGGFHYAYPPWMAALLAPFHFIEIYLSRAIMGGLTLLICAFTNRALKGDMISFILFIVSIPTLSLLGNGQVDGIPILGLGLLFLNSPYWKILGIILVLAKPQTFLFAIPILLLNPKKRVEIISAVTLFIGLSFLVWGWWITPLLEMSQSLFPLADLSPWPYGIPVGIGLIYWAYKTENVALGALATIFLVPYLALHSYAGYTLILYAQLPRRWAVAAYLAVMILGGLAIRFVSIYV